MVEKIKNNIGIIIFFSIVLIVGIITFKDYGITTDERLQRNHSLVNYYQYTSIIDSITGGSSLKNIDKKIKDNSLDKNSKNIYQVEYGLKVYPYKYYGVGIQLPLVMIEHLTNFKMDIASVFYMRHLAVFLLYFVSLIYFYLMLEKFIIKNKKLSLLGTAFLLFSPRIYGDAFYNIKDLAFMSLCIINCYYALKYLKNNSNRNILKLSIISAFTINSRIIGGIIVFLLLVFKLIKIIRSKIPKEKQHVFDIFKIIIFTVLIFIIITPPSWVNPIGYFIDCVGVFFNYTDLVNDTELFCFYFGKLISSRNLPWHYPLVWIFITTPLIYIILSIIGIIKNKRELFIKYLNSILIIVLGVMIIFRPTLYGGWRHLYFLYPLIIVNSILGFKYIMNKYKKLNKFFIVLLAINFIGITGWCIINHPYEMEYFSSPFANYKMKEFELNYWKISNTDALKYIAKIDKRKNITVESDWNVSINKILPKEERKRFKVFEFGSVKNPDYIIDTSKNYNDKLKENYKEIKIKKINKVRLYTIYKKK